MSDHPARTLGPCVQQLQYTAKEANGPDLTPWRTDMNSSSLGDPSPRQLKSMNEREAKVAEAIVAPKSYNISRHLVLLGIWKPILDPGTSMIR